MTENYKRYGKYLKLDYTAESFYSKSYKSKFFGTDNFYKIFSFDEISEQVTEDPIIFNKFMNIIKANSKLNHSNIIKIIDFHDFHTTYALISEYFSNEPLLALMASYFKRKKKIPTVVAVFIIAQVCDAVGYAQSQNILHGNINPLNILITHEGIVKVKEFSFFNNLSISTNVKALNFKQFRYIAPEKFSSNIILPQSDVYSLAVILYEMLTGKIIYSSKDMDILISKIQKGKFIPINRLNPDVPKDLVALVEKGLSLNPENRFDDPIKFKYAIQRYLIQGDKIFSAQHFHTLISKLFLTSITKEVKQNSSYQNLVLDNFINELKPVANNSSDNYFVPDVDDDLFEGDSDKTSILFDNIDNIDSVDEIKGLTSHNATEEVFKADINMYEEDEETNILDDSSDDVIDKSAINKNMYDDDEETNILDDDNDDIIDDSAINKNMYDDDEKTNILDDDEEDSIDIEPQEKKKKKKRNSNKSKKEELIKLLNNNSDFNMKSFIIGAITGLAIGLIIAFLK